MTILNAQNFTMTIAASALILIAAGCSIEGTTSKDGNANASALAGTYSYSQNGCSTGQQTYSSVQELCQKLPDSTLNKGCAEDLRQMEFQKTCVPAGYRWATEVVPYVPHLRTLPTPISTPSSAARDCLDRAQAAPRGPEVSLSQFIDFHGGAYRLSDAIEMVRATEGHLSMSAGLSLTAQTDINLKNPSASDRIYCTDLSEAPRESLKYKFDLPAVIKRQTGSLEGNVAVSLTISGDDQASDSKAYGEPKSSVSYLNDLAQSAQSLHIYQVSASVFQIVSSNSVNTDGLFYEVISSAIYISEPTMSVSPTPAPVAASPESVAATTKICNRYFEPSDKVDCLVKFKDGTVPLNVIPVCDRFFEINDKVSCMMKFKQKQLSENALNVCNRYFETSDRVDCLVKLEGFEISDSILSTCNQFFETSDRVDCVVKLAK